MKQLLPKAFFTAALGTALLLAPSSVWAQVKIGSNPTTIDRNNNLEVESAAPQPDTPIWTGTCGRAYIDRYQNRLVGRFKYSQ